MTIESLADSSVQNVSNDVVPMIVVAGAPGGYQQPEQEQRMHRMWHTFQALV